MPKKSTTRPRTRPASRKSKPPRMLGRDELMATKTAPADRVRIIEVPGHGRVCLLKWGGPELDQWDRATYAIIDANPSEAYPGTVNVRARLFVATVCDEEGRLLFSESDLDDVAAFDPALLEVVYRTGSELNALGMGAVDATEGKSEATTGKGSATA